MPARKKPVTDEAAPPKPAKAPRVTKPRAKKPAALKGLPPGDDAKTPRKKSPARTGTPTGKKLVIVESPAKGNTINKYLGPDFVVLASYGHVRDLPKGRKKKGETVSGINIEEGWKPRYEVPEPDKNSGRRRTPKDILAELRKAADNAPEIYLATDPDREGEAIAWHLQDELELDEARTFRVTFNEITKSAVQRAMQHPEKVDMDRVKAQEARRMLDRVVGYPLSNFLGDKITKGLTAGRVQSVALRLVVDREREIEAFKTEEYWRLFAELAPAGTVGGAKFPYQVVLSKKKAAKEEAVAADEPQGDPANEDAPPAEPKEKAAKSRPGAFQAELSSWNGTKFDSTTEEATRLIAEVLDQSTYSITKIEQKDRSEKAPPPFTTSSLQQQANLRIGFTAQRTMNTAQKLYEGVPLGSEGQVALITYMRTDSTRISEDALKAVRSHIQSSYGDAYLPAKANYYSSGKSAQEAHEAIRPTDVAYTPQRVANMGLSGDQLKLYTLIYHRFVACQMSPAVFAVTNVEITSVGNGVQGTGLFKTQGKILKFDGFRKVMSNKQEDATLPSLSEAMKLDRLAVTASQHFTEPPPRFNEASLVKSLEKEGIGRPSTYASIIGKITSDKRGYVEVKDRKFFATEIGKVATDLLVQNFPRVMDLQFTSKMEEELDQIASKQSEMVTVLNEFWAPFNDALTTAREKLGSIQGQETGEMCPTCGKPLVKMFSRKTGNSFIGCSGYKEGCKYIKPREGEEGKQAAMATDVVCTSCGKPMLQRFSRRGPFLGCSGYPECKVTMNIAADGKPVVSAMPTEHKCDKCGMPMVQRSGKRGPFLACSGYPKCKNAQDMDANGNPVRPIETGINCDKCNSPMTVKKGPRGPFLSCSGYPKCRNAKPLPEELKEKVKDLFPPPAPKKEAPAVTIDQVCPTCGAAMKLRQGRKGYFLGCSKYPKCKGVCEPSVELLEQISVLAATGAMG